MFLKQPRIFEDYLYLAVRYIVIQIISIVALFLFVKSPADIYVYTFISMMSNAGGNILNWRYIKKNGVESMLKNKSYDMFIQEFSDMF